EAGRSSGSPSGGGWGSERGDREDGSWPSRSRWRRSRDRAERAAARQDRPAPSQAMPRRIGDVGVAPPYPMVRQSFTWTLARAVLANEGKQVIEVERLLQKRFRVEVACARLIERREDDDGDRRERRIGLLLPAELPAVHHRHHQVEQNHPRRVPVAQILERFAAVRDR